MNFNKALKKSLIASIFFFNTTIAQDNFTDYINIGSLAPALKLHEYFKGKEIKEFEKGRIYVVEFWATWCGPCIEEMPRLSTLAKKYKDKVTVVGVNIYERKSLSAVKSFVDSMEQWMSYTIAAQDSNFMEISWMDAAGESTIPNSFVINEDGEIAWIGYTGELTGPLSKIVNHDWDLQKAKSDRDLEKRLGKLDYKIFQGAIKYNDDRYATDFYGEPDSALLLINSMIDKEPNLKYGYYIAFSTLHALIRKDPNKAYEYGKSLMTLENPSYDAIISCIKYFPYLYQTLPPKLFGLGADACLAKINLYPYSTKTARNYFMVADWYLRANNRKMAKKNMIKAIKALRSKKRIIMDRPL